jgi:RHS repeat-associated protein
MKSQFTRSDNIPPQYDESGQRVLKHSTPPGTDSQTAYINQYSDDIKDSSGTMETKHIFAGNQRITSVMTLSGTTNYFYYQTDHLGSTGYLTDKDGTLKEHIEYTPWGESWFSNPGTPVLDYKFTGKEQDNTGFYYFGARYYDPQTSVWQSPDPILGKYLDDSKNQNSGKNGSGDTVEKGVYNSMNLSLYSYAGQNPVILLDPNGLWAVTAFGTANAEGGLVAISAGGSVSKGGGVFVGDTTSIGTYSTYGGFARFGMNVASAPSTNKDENFAVGGNAGVGGGISFSPDAKKASDFGGEFHVGNLTIGSVTLQYAEGKNDEGKTIRVFSASEMYGPPGFGISGYNTNTPDAKTQYTFNNEANRMRAENQYHTEQSK